MSAYIRALLMIELYWYNQADKGITAGINCVQIQLELNAVTESGISFGFWNEIH